MRKKMGSFARMGMIRRKKASLAIFLVSAFSFIIVLSVLILQSSMRKTELEQRKDIYGEWTASVTTISDAVVEAVSRHEIVNEVGIIKLGGMFEVKDSFQQMASLDEKARKLGRLDLLDGSFPEKKNEIAVEMSVLTQLGYSYELGQKISLTLMDYDASGKRISWKENFTLCGVLRDYSIYWKAGKYGYPSIFATEEALPSYKENRIVLMDIKEKEEKVINDLKQIGGETFLLNDNTYYELSEVGSGTNLLDKTNFVFFILTLMTVLFIFQLFSASLEKRKESLLILRMIGADKGQMKALLLWEGFYLWIVSMVLGTVVGFLGSGLLIWLSNQMLHTKLIFSIQIPYVLGGILMVSLGIWIGMCVPILGVEKIGNPKKEMVHSAFFRRFKKKRSKYFSEGEIWQREKRIHWKQNWFVLGSSFLSAIILFSLVSTIGDRISEFKDIGKSDYRSGAYFWWYDKKPVYPQDIPEKMKNVVGMDHVDTLRCTNYLPIKWENMKHSTYAPVLAKCFSKYYEKREGPFCAVLGIQKEETMFDFYKSNIAEGKVEEASFWEGNEVILYLPPLYIDEEGEWIVNSDKDGYVIAETYYETTIQVGDMITITGEQGEKKVKVSGIIHEFKGNDYRGIASAQRYGVIASNTFFNQLQKKDAPVSYYYIEGYVGKEADFRTTDREMSVIMQEVQKEGSFASLLNQRIEKERAMENAISSITISVLLLFATVFLVMLLQWNIVQTKAVGIRKKIGILRAIGISKKKLQLKYFKSNIAPTIITFMLVIPVGICIRTWLYLEELKGREWGIPWTPPSTPITIWKELFLPMCQRMPWGLLAILLISYLIIMAIISYRPYQKVIKQEITTNLREL